MKFSPSELSYLVILQKTFENHPNPEQAVLDKLRVYTELTGRALYWKFKRFLKLPKNNSSKQ
jgi:hypothetical protein